MRGEEKGIIISYRKALISEFEEKGLHRHIDNNWEWKKIGARHQSKKAMNLKPKRSRQVSLNSTPYSTFSLVNGTLSEMLARV